VLVFAFNVTETPYGVSTGSGKLQFVIKIVKFVHMTWAFSVPQCNQHAFRGKANTGKSETPYWRTGMT